MFTRSAATGLLHDSTETAFYIASAPLTAARAALASINYMLDLVTISER